jgi:hypothetical protein
MANIPVIPGVKVATKGILNKPIKDIICAILFGGINNMLKGNLICIEANLNEILADQGLANLTDLKDALNELKDEVKAFQEHLGVGEAIKRANEAIADVQKVLSLGGMCPVPMRAPKIPDVLNNITNSYFGAANNILNDLGRLAKPQLCLDAAGGINTGAYNPDSILGSLNRKLGRLGDIPGNELDKLTKSIKGVSKAIKKQINRDLFPDFRHKHNLQTGAPYVAGSAVTTIAPRPPEDVILAMDEDPNSYPPADAVSLNQAHSQALQLVSALNQTGSYPVKANGIAYNNMWLPVVGPEIYGLAVDALTPQDPTLIRQEPVYDYCGRLVGYKENVILGDRSAEGDDPIIDAVESPVNVNHTMLWVNAPDEGRVGWAEEGNVSEQLVGLPNQQRLTTALNLNPEITLYRGRSHVVSIPSTPEFYIYETKTVNDQLVPDTGKRFSKGLMRFETNEFLDEANGRNEDIETWAGLGNTGPEPAAWRRKDLFPTGTTLMINVGGTVGEPDEEGFVIYENWPDHLAYSNEDGSVFGLIKII